LFRRKGPKYTVHWVQMNFTVWKQQTPVITPIDYPTKQDYKQQDQGQIFL